MYVLLAGTVLLAYVIYKQVKWLFSPFRSIPAPYEYPIIGHNPYLLFGKNDTLTLFKKWAEEFKDFGMFRLKTITSISDYTVVLLKPDQFKFVWSRPEVFIRTPFFRTYFPLAGDGLLTSTGALHRWQKKMLAKMFSMAQTKYYIPVFNKHVSVMIKIWKSLLEKTGASENVDIKYYTSNLSFDIIGETAFGYQFNSQTTTSNPITKVFRDKLEGVFNDKSLILFQYFPFLKYFPFGVGKVFQKVEKDAGQLVEEVFNNRLEKIRNETLTEVEKNDFFSILINSVDEKTGERFSESLIKNNAYTFMLAGHETTASSVPGVLYYLAKFPAYQERCREEIRHVLDENEDPTFDDLGKLEFTSAFLKETMRMFTTVAIAGRICTRDVVIDGHQFPKGTHFLVPPFLANENELAFNDAKNFNPERYLDNDDGKVGISFTFGYGSYSCIGKHFAMQELKVIIVRLLQNFKFTIDSECDTFYRKVKISMVFYPPMKIRIHAI